MRGESLPSAASSRAVAAAGNKVTVTITPAAGAQYYNVYRSEAGGSASSAKFIGRIAQGAGSPVFTDLGNRSPGGVTGFLIQGNTLGFAKLAPFSQLKLAVHDLSTPTAFFSFLSLAAYQPRKNVLLDSISGQL